MGLMSVIERRGSLENPSTSLANPAAWLAETLGGAPSAAGVAVGENTALNLSAVYRAASVLANALASVPLKVMEKTGADAKRDASEHPLYPVLQYRPNPEMVAFVWKQTAMVHALLWGNHYAEIETNGRGEVVALWPLLPDRTRVARGPSGQKFYLTRVAGEDVPLAAERVFHIPALGFDGRSGIGIVQRARESLGLALAAERFGAAFFGNGANAGGVLEHPGQLSDAAHARLRTSWEMRHQGLSNAHRIAILEEGMKFSATAIEPDKAQFLETRQFQVVEVARWFGVPPHMIYELSRATFSNIEHQSIEFVRDSLMPWVILWQQTIDTTLFTTRDRFHYVARFVVDGLERGDAASRYATYAIARQNAILNADEIRERENINPIPNGEGALYLVNGNMVSLAAASHGGEPAAGATAADPAQRSTDPGVRESIVRAQRGTFAAVAAGVLSAEANALRRAARRKANDGADATLVRLWAAEYAETRAAAWEDALSAPLASLAHTLDAMAGAAVHVSLAVEVCRSHATAERERFDADVASALAASPDDPGGAVAELADQWEGVGPERVAASLVGRIIDELQSREQAGPVHDSGRAA